MIKSAKTHPSRIPAILWTAAFICALFPVNAYQLEFFLGAVLLLFTWAVLTLHTKSVEGWMVPKAPVLLFGGLFWFLVFASLFWSDIKPASLNGLCLFSLFPLTFFVGIIAGRDEFFSSVVRALAMLFAILAAWAVFQFFFLNAYFMGQARHPLADPSSLGALFSLALFCSLGWIVSDRPLHERRLATALAALLVCGIMATVARGPVFAFIPGIALLTALLWPQVKARRKALLLVMLAGVAFYALTLTGLQKSFDLGTRVFGTVTMGVEKTANNRLDIWSSTIDMIKARPLLGTGFGTFAQYYPEYRRATETDGVYLAHNDPLQYWAELGVLGPFLFYAFIIAAALRSFSALRKTETDPRLRIIIVTIFAALTAMIAQSHVSFNLYNASILMLTGFLLAVWFRATQRVLPTPVTTATLPASMSLALRLALIAAPFVMLGWLVCGLVLGEHFVNRARDNLFKEEMFAFADNINRANAVSNGLSFRAYTFAVNVPLSILQYPTAGTTDETRKKLYDQVLDYMDRIEDINPRDPSPAYYRAKVQQMVPSAIIPQGTPSPEFYYKESLRLQPLQIGARLELLNIYTREKRPLADRIALMEPGINFMYISPLAKDYYSAMSRLYLEDGDYDKVKQTMMRLNDFQRRSDYSLARQNTGIPAAITGGDATLPNFR